MLLCVNQCVKLAYCPVLNKIMYHILNISLLFHIHNQLPISLQMKFVFSYITYKPNIPA